MAQHGMPADRSGAYIEMLDSFNSSGWIKFGVPNTEHASKAGIDLLTAVKSLDFKNLPKHCVDVERHSPMFLKSDGLRRRATGHLCLCR